MCAVSDLKVKIKADESISFSGKHGSIFDAKPHHDGGYFIYWWYGVGNCYQYIHTFMELIALAKSEV